MRSRVFLPLALVTLFAGCATAPAPTPASAGAAASTAAAPPAVAMVTGDSGEPLRKGMTAAEVRRIMGAPAEIEPFAAPSGKAEVWVYHRTIVGPVQQVQVGEHAVTQQVTGADGISRSQTLAQTPIYKQMHVDTKETIRLLIFNDQFAEQKVSVARQEVFE